MGSLTLQVDGPITGRAYKRGGGGGGAYKSDFTVTGHCGVGSSVPAVNWLLGLKRLKQKDRFTIRAFCSNLFLSMRC